MKEFSLTKLPASKVQNASAEKSGTRFTWIQQNRIQMKGAELPQWKAARKMEESLNDLEINDLSYICGRHCKLCPFPGYKCNGRPTKLNYHDPQSAFTKLYSAENPADKNMNQSCET